jgi:hypothetical protein
MSIVVYFVGVLTWAIVCGQHDDPDKAVLGVFWPILLPFVALWFLADHVATRRWRR